MLIKIDIAKAFDTVNWRFLLGLLQHLGFSRRWIDWVSLILSSASTKIEKYIKNKKFQYIQLSAIEKSTPCKNRSWSIAFQFGPR